MSDLPYPDDRGRTHFPGCYRHARHHNCAVAECDRLRAINAELVEALELILPLAKGYNASQGIGVPKSNGRYVKHAEDALARAKDRSNG